jgi:hypothetical protein
MNADTYADILPGVNAVVHTIGTLLDNTQRNKQFHDKDFIGLFKSITGISPVEARHLGAYDKLNRDTGEPSRPDVAGTGMSFICHFSYPHV